MAADPINDALYERLRDSALALEKPISGLESRVEISSSADLQTAEQAALTELRAHHRQIDGAISLYNQLQEIMNELSQTVWPAVPTFVLPEPMWSESQTENAELAAAAEIFVPASTPATHFVLTEGEQEPPVVPTLQTGGNLSDSRGTGKPAIYNPRQRR